MFKLKCVLYLLRHLLVSRYISCAVNFANLQGVLIKHPVNGIKELPLLWCSILNKNTWRGPTEMMIEMNTGGVAATQISQIFSLFFFVRLHLHKISYLSEKYIHTSESINTSLHFHGR